MVLPTGCNNRIPETIVTDSGGLVTTRTGRVENGGRNGPGLAIKVPEVAGECL
jgi:hypothetical protein